MTWNNLKKQVRNNGGFTLLDIGQAVVNAVDELDARMNIVEGWVKVYTVAPPKPTPTDEELVEKYCLIIGKWIEDIDYEEKCPLADILRQLLAEVKGC